MFECRANLGEWTIRSGYAYFFTAIIVRIIGSAQGLANIYIHIYIYIYIHREIIYFYILNDIL